MFGRYGQCNCADETCLQACPETPEAYQCMRCAEGKYNFDAGSTCKACPSTGAVCRGGLNGSAGVSAKRGYYGYMQTDTLRRESESSDHELSMFLCPVAEQCCRHDQCIVNGVTECPPTRDPETPLCGSCIGNLSETLGSVDCTQCSGINWRYVFTRLLLYCVLLYYLYYSAKNVSNDTMPVVQIIVTKCLTYFYQVTHTQEPTLNCIMVQVLPLLVDSESVTAVLQPLLSVFALRDSNGDGDGQCLIDGLDAMGKLLVPLAGPLLMVLAPCVFLVMYRLSVSRTIDQGEST